MIGGPTRTSTLIGLARIRFDDAGLIVHDIEVHYSSRFWIRSPSAAVVIDDELIRDSRGDIRYRPALPFDPDAADAILAAVEAYDPSAFAEGDDGEEDARDAEPPGPA